MEETEMEKIAATALIVFASQFTFIALKGSQQINVVAGRFWAAGAISLGLGVSGLVTLDIIANAMIHGSHWSVYASYLASGVCGIWAAMMIEKRRSK
jgi:uncharacterized membrane protein YuzA (DUF378 family)